MSPKEDVESTIQRLFQDLEIEGEAEVPGKLADLSVEFHGVRTASVAAFRKIGLDAAVLAGLWGDWNLSLEFATRLLHIHDDRLAIKLWQLRCLVELERFAEAVALSASNHWDATLVIHVNYLTGLAFERLGMKEKARLHFGAVAKSDASYKDIASRLSNY